MNRMLKACTVLLISATPLAAQQPAHHPMAGRGQGMAGMHNMNMGMMDSMMGPMMQAMAMAPEHLLMQKDKLHLTAQQQQLTTIRDAAKTAHDQAASQAGMHLREMVQAMQAAQPDTNTIRTHFAAAFRFMQAAHWAMVKSAAEAWPVLTSAQQQQVKADTTNCCGGGMRH